MEGRAKEMDAWVQVGDDAVLVALRAIRQNSARGAAPHVVAQIVRAIGRARERAAQIAEMLTPQQLRGEAALPDPMPLPPELLEAAQTDPAQSRLLLFAALSETHDPIDIVQAAGLEVDILLRREVREFLTIHDGAVAFVDPLVRLRALHLADPREKRNAHAALARSAWRREDMTATAWHIVQAQRAPSASVAARLLNVADRALALGDPVTADRYVSAVVPHLDGARRVRAVTLAGLAAFWSGRVGEALTRLGEVSGSHGDLDSRVEALVRAAEVMEGSRRAASPGAEARDLALAAAPGSEDNRILSLLLEAGVADDVGPGAIDRQHAEIILAAARPARRSPIVDFRLQVFLTQMHLGQGDPATAARILTDAILRLPLAGIAGEVGDLIRTVENHGGTIDVRIAEALEMLGPRRSGGAFPASILRPGPLAVEALERVRAVHEPVGLPALPGLSRRQQEVVRLLTSGKSNKEIGQQLGLSERTVEVHLGHAYRKVGVGSRVELIARMLAVGK